METIQTETAGEQWRQRSELPEQESSKVAHLVEETLEGGFRWLRFPPPLETIFEQETSAARVRHMIVAGIIAIVTFNLFLLSDFIMASAIFRSALLIRVGIVTPLTILVMVAQYRGLSPQLREGTGAMITICGGVGLIYLLLLLRDGGSTHYIYDLFLVIMFGNIVLRLRFWYAVAASLAVVSIYIAVRLNIFGVLPFEQINTIFILISTVTFTLFANYSLEKDHRRSYLLNLRERIRQASLSERNHKLAELSHIDPLTGLPNRRELAEFLDLLLQKPESDQLAIVMFDVDHFKLYNDRYGHPMGDECLRQIARVLAESSRKSADLVARFGGEEFLAVLPGCDLSTAERFAGRILSAVQNLKIPHETSPVSAYISISAGVAVGRVSASADVQPILTAADSALYRAKSAGRNCVQL